MATNTKIPAPPSSNGVITGPPKGVVGGNRKKQKRRAKQQAAKAASHSHPPPPPGAHPAGLDYDEDPLGYGDDDDYDYSEAEHYHEQYIPAHPHGNMATNGYSAQQATSSKKSKKKKATPSQLDYNPELLGNPNIPASASSLSHLSPPPSASHHLPHTHNHKHSGGGPGGMSDRSIWNTSTAQERHNIKEFWLSLSEEERKSLLKIEKEAVLRKMKQQQKHSCSCTVCGRKRTAIEEELEVLYEGYYEELEQYAHHDHPPLPSLPGSDGMIPDPLSAARHPLAAPPPNPRLERLHHHRTSQLQEHFDDDDYSDEEDEEDEFSDDDYSDSELDPVVRGGTGVPDFFNFGQNLTVKDNLLTVADDLLKNDGRKFIEMMEQLAERRMARESEAEYAAANPSHPGGYPPGDPAYNHEDPLAAGDEFDDDEASYDSQEDYEDDLEDEDELVSRVGTRERTQKVLGRAMDLMGFTEHSMQGGLTEEQRMQEGRRMFQIFAARMFEQRVLTAYKEKVAAERQQKLLEELEDETKLEAQREAKKQRDAQKKKDKKKQQQQAKAEERAKKEAEKAAEEARVREAEEKKQEEQRRKKEEQRKKKEEEKRKMDEERAKKEADKAKRQQEEQQRREEAERKAKEVKAAEKAKKDEARKQEREAREAREKEMRERKAQEEKDKKEREDKAKAEVEAKEREKAATQAAQPPAQPSQPLQIQKRPSQPGMVAVPGVYPKQTASGVSSPHPSVATPAIPKAPTPAKQRQTSQQGSLASSPKLSTSTPMVSSVPSKSSSPNSAGAQPPAPLVQPKTVLQKPANQQQQQHGPQIPQHPIQQQQNTTSMSNIQPPPGMPYPPAQQHPPGFGGMQPMGGYPGFQGSQPPMMHGNMSQRAPSMPMYNPHQGSNQISTRFGGPAMNGMPHGAMPQQQQVRGMGHPFEPPSTTQPPPGFTNNAGSMQQQQQPQHTPPIGQMPASYLPGNVLSSPADTSLPRAPAGLPSHSRQPSASDKERFESAANQPIARPAPIQRPSSVKPPQSQERRGSNTDLDDLSKHLGSSALLDDSDEPEPLGPSSGLVENRRTSGIQPPARNTQAPIGGLSGGMPTGGFGAPGTTFGSPGGNTWNTPTLPFGQNSSLGHQQTWPGMTGWSNNNAFNANSSFGAIGGGYHQGTRPAGFNRPLAIRLAVCQACKQLTSANRGEGDAYHPIEILLRQIEANRPPLDAPPTLREIEDICETEGDAQNGGGELRVRKDAFGEKFAVMWAPDPPQSGTADHYHHGHGGVGGGRGGTLPGLGEIGSPMPNKSLPTSAAATSVGGGFGAPGAPPPGMGRSGSGSASGAFQGLGAVGDNSTF